jgi:hypothetical protein
MQYPHTAVSGYWIITNKHGNKFMDWFKTTLAINTPYVFFGTAETIAIAKQFRQGLPTHYVELNIEDMYCYKFRDRMITDPRHCPSTELNIIWNEKLFLLQKAASLNPFQSQFFSWIDAGVCTYRNEQPPPTPFPNPTLLASLPTDKIIFTSSNEPYFQVQCVSPTNYYHYISGTTYMLHRSFIDKFAELYKTYLETHMSKANIYTDQVILTYIFKDRPHLFYKLGHGYGALLHLLK